MKNASDAIVVGGGPSGSFTALKLAEHSVNVTVFEEHSEIGIPSHCPGHLSIKGLKQLKLHPLPTEIVENTFHGATFYSPSGNEFSVHFSSPVTCTVNRALFDRYIANKAENVGAEYCLNSRVESLIIEDSFVKGVTVEQEGKTQRNSAKIVIDAEGVSPRLSREAGLPGPDRDKLVNGVEAEVENVENTEPDTVEVYLGKNYAPGFYAWLIPKKDEKTKVGLAAKTGNPRKLLQKLMHEHPAARKKLRNARILQTTFHPITLGGLSPRVCANGFLAVGDAASQVKPTTGGGVLFGMTCAQIAAKVAYEAIDRNDLSSRFLARYQKECREALGFDVKIMLRMRKTLDAMSDRTIDSMIAMCTKLGLDKTLQNVEDIDFQGQSLLRVLRSPRMLTALGYFFFAYLSANL
jgi:digeranylgeranylglycerophospholipid reductase